MDDAAEARKETSFPFLLKAVAVFLAADGAFKLAAIFSRVSPGPPIFGAFDSDYYYLLVAVVDISLAVQIFGRAHYAWIWSLAFFALQAAVLLTYFIFSSPVAWLTPGVFGRVQIVVCIALYMLLARYFASRPVREILSPHKEESD
jgi:hypothetical protein